MDLRANVLWTWFNKGKKANGKHYRAFCKACIAYFQENAQQQPLLDENGESLSHFAAFQQGQLTKKFFHGRDIHKNYSMSRCW